MSEKGGKFENLENLETVLQVLPSLPSCEESRIAFEPDHSEISAFCVASFALPHCRRCDNVAKMCKFAFCKQIFRF